MATKIESNTNRRGRAILLAAAGCSIAVALFHALIPLVVLFIGQDAYSFFGGYNQAKAVQAGASVRAALICLSLALLFVIWALYAFSGAGKMRRLPLLRAGLLVIGVIYTLRGLELVPEIIPIFNGRLHVPVQFLGFSAVSLAIGVLYLVGTVRAWSDLSTQNFKSDRNQLN